MIFLIHGVVINMPDLVVDGGETVVFYPTSKGIDEFNKLSVVDGGILYVFGEFEVTTLAADTFFVGCGGLISLTKNISISAGSARINVGGVISNVGGGYTTAESPAPGSYSSPATGGGHAGRGGNSDIEISVDNPYGDILAPTSFGSGSYGDYGGNGGGAIHFSVIGDLIIDGKISVNGESMSAGGSVWIEAGRLTGQGRVTANGGGGGSRIGSGGGGYVTVYADECYFNGLFSASGGSYDDPYYYSNYPFPHYVGSPGPVYVSCAGVATLTYLNTQPSDQHTIILSSLAVNYLYVEGIELVMDRNLPLTLNVSTLQSKEQLAKLTMGDGGTPSILHVTEKIDGVAVQIMEHSDLVIDASVVRASKFVTQLNATSTPGAEFALEIYPNYKITKRDREGTRFFSRGTRKMRISPETRKSRFSRISCESGNDEEARYSLLHRK